MVQDEFKVTRLSNFVKYLSNVDLSSKFDPSNKTKLKTKKLPKKDLKSTKDQNNAQRVIGLGDHVPAFLTINLRN